MKHMILVCGWLLVVMALPGIPAVSWADTKTQLIRETAEYALQRFGVRAATREATEVLASQIARSAAKNGDAVITAVRQVGPRALRLVEEAGAHSPQFGSQAARFLATHGGEAAFVL